MVSPLLSVNEMSAVPAPIDRQSTCLAVTSGRWRIIGHHEGLLRLFPAAPEMFHRRRADLPGPSVGPHGAAEKPDGSLRPLTAEEAQEIGLFDPGFQQFYFGEDLERRLNAGRV